MSADPTPDYMKPVPVRTRLAKAATSLVILALAAGMILKPNLLTELNPEQAGTHHTQTNLHILKWAWSRPVGIGVGVFGMLVLWSATNRFEDTRSLTEVMKDRAGQ